MSPMRFRRFKLPVVSRLAWAWLGFAALGSGAALYVMHDPGRTRAAVAMAVEGVEFFAPPKPRASAPPERLARSPAPGDEAPFAPDAEDMLADAASLPVVEDPGADIYITVDGAPARAIGAQPASAVAVLKPVAEPDPALSAKSAYGPIPRIGEDGRRPSKAYAQAFAPGEAPEIALIVGGLGLNRELTERAIDELPAGVTLAFAPYAKDLPYWTKRARAAGHETMIEIPMENGGEGDDAALGPAALLTSRSAEENARRLDWILSRFQGYFGATNYLGAKFSGDARAMGALLARLDAAGVAYIDDTGLLRRPSGEVGAVDRLIDPGYGKDQGRTKRDLEALEKAATAGGAALGKTYVNDATLGDIVKWATSLESRGMALAPGSAVLAMQADSR